jgi:hypothetical protein
MNTFCFTPEEVQLLHKALARTPALALQAVRGADARQLWVLRAGAQDDVVLRAWLLSPDRLQLRVEAAAGPAAYPRLVAEFEHWSWRQAPADARHGPRPIAEGPRTGPAFRQIATLAARLERLPPLPRAWPGEAAPEDAEAPSDTQVLAEHCLVMALKCRREGRDDLAGHYHRQYRRLCSAGRGPWRPGTHQAIAPLLSHRR